MVTDHSSHWQAILHAQEINHKALASTNSLDTESLLKRAGYRTWLVTIIILEQCTVLSCEDGVKCCVCGVF